MPPNTGPSPLTAICCSTKITYKQGVNSTKVGLHALIFYKKNRLAAADMERVKGIEPSLKAWEALVLPLNYTRKMFYYYIILPSFCKGFAENNFQQKIPEAIYFGYFNMPK